jgi:XTP/dITP diphosphohydrolase
MRYTDPTGDQIQAVQIGSGRFGHDPMFRPKGFEKTFAERSMEEKNAISHRGKAVKTLADFLK